MLDMCIQLQIFIKYKEIYKIFTFYYFVGAYNLQERFYGRSCQDCGDNEPSTTYISQVVTINIGAYMILS